MSVQCKIILLFMLATLLNLALVTVGPGVAPNAVLAAGGGSTYQASP